jgi:hypothetical protein
VTAPLVDVGGLDGDGVIVLLAGLAGLGGVGLAVSKAYGAAAKFLMLSGLVGAGTAIYDHPPIRERVSL